MNDRKQTKPHFNHEIHILHPNGHITRAKIDLSKFDNLEPFKRAAFVTEYVTEAIQAIKEQCPNAEIFLINKSKYKCHES